MLAYVYLFSFIIKSLKEKNKGSQKSFYYDGWKDWVLLQGILRCNEE